MNSRDFVNRIETGKPGKCASLKPLFQEERHCLCFQTFLRDEEEKSLLDLMGTTFFFLLHSEHSFRKL